VTTTAQNITTYQGVSETVTWSETGVDNSAQTPTLAVRNSPDDVTIAGTAALVGADTVYTVIITPAVTDTLDPGRRPYQLHVTTVGVVATGEWKLIDSYAD
jgi:hypothetical protein